MLGNGPIGARPIAGRAYGPNDGNGSGLPSYPPGWRGTLPFQFYAWQDNSGPSSFQALCRTANFPVIVKGISVVLDEMDALYAGRIPTPLQFIFDNVPVPNGKKYYIVCHLPLASLSSPAGAYPFQTRLMKVKDTNRNIPVDMLVPVLSPANFPLVTPYINTLIANLRTILTANGNFVLIGIGMAVTSGGYFDAQMTVPSDYYLDTSPQVAIANWAASPYNVTMATLPTLYGKHFQTIAQGAGKGLFLLCPVLNPGNGIIGQGGGGGSTGQDYQLFTNAVANAMYAIGDSFTIMDASLTPNPERSSLVAAANYSGSFACQITGLKANGDVYTTVQQAIARKALFFELTGYVGGRTGASQIDLMAIAGWNGTTFIPPYTPAVAFSST